MRIRIVKQPSGIVDGVDLGRLVEGNTYDVGTSIGNLLLSDQLAVPVDDEHPVLVLPIDHPIAERFRAAPDERETAGEKRQRRGR